MTVEGEDRTGINFILSGTAATVGFNPAARPGEEVKLSYTKPETNVLKDLAENEVESFTNLPVTNNLAATAPEAPGTWRRRRARSRTRWC